MSRPDYIAQTADFMRREERFAWLETRASEAREAGCVDVRAVQNPELGLLLLEGWKERQTEYGEPEWQLTEGAPA